MTVCDETSDTRTVRHVRPVTSGDGKENILIYVADHKRKSLSNF